MHRIKILGGSFWKMEKATLGRSRFGKKNIFRFSEMVGFLPKRQKIGKLKDQKEESREKSVRGF